MLKPNKDITQQEKCRPINVINIDTKILNKINKMNPEIYKINHD